jgi:LysR family transcriptional regulator for metE and metH
MLNLEVRHLKLIAAVAEEGGITRAANRLHLTQSALSHQLRDIESKLGASLFLRLNKRMVLTQAGERLLSSALGVLCELERVEEDIRHIAENKGGILRISTECYTCYHWLPSTLKVFSKLYPRVEVRIVAEATHHPVEALLGGRLDLAITSSVVRNRKLLFKPLFRDEMVAVVSPDHPLAGRAYLTAKDFSDQHLIVYSLPKEELTIFQRVLMPAGVTPRQLSQIDLTEAIIEMVKAGLGIATMARWAVAPHLKSSTLRAVPLTKNGLHRQWSAAMMKSNSVPPYLMKFVELLAENPIPLMNAPMKMKAVS